MEHNRASYSAEEKKQIIIDILSKKTTIQKISREKGIAATLISLWKKQALEAMAARFVAQHKGRPKAVRVEAPSDEALLKAARNEARSAKIRASHLESSLREAREKLARLEEQLGAVAAILDCSVVKGKATRRGRKPRKSAEG